ncbi:putative rapid ALkalinization Factor [Lupinus albus]|uniref:Putative rapid ALkalinization Factor n=1 Tax=Lupinus albus TaxID=3870 RepID=A0A6A4PHW0_LUPAL|nr:putative rapid ALkalinization Factor [Lupinus albus]
MDSQKTQKHSEPNKHITFEAMKHSIAPCGKNCVPPQSNPYRRGCSMICRCRK